MPPQSAIDSILWLYRGSRTKMGSLPAMRLATEIAAQFRHIPPDAAAATIADHIRKFWEPRLRAQLLEQVARAGAGCDPHVAAAADILANSAS
ncbi:formate dehydrogenase subunit delta [Nocardia sp. CA-135398]|uniref:formate dehydrogenase subunit delta n=1 Tax=Nocardia sp. CA-135398 TaxID=3239977 RepID=UPI003D96D728